VAGLTAAAAAGDKAGGIAAEHCNACTVSPPSESTLLSSLTQSRGCIAIFRLFALLVVLRSAPLTTEARQQVPLCPVWTTEPEFVTQYEIEGLVSVSANGLGRSGQAVVYQVYGFVGFRPQVGQPVTLARIGPRLRPCGRGLALSKSGPTPSVASLRVGDQQLPVDRQRFAQQRAKGSVPAPRSSNGTEPEGQSKGRLAIESAGGIFTRGRSRLGRGIVHVIGGLGRERVGVLP